jgi:hypothetical protein
MIGSGVVDAVRVVVAGVVADLAVPCCWVLQRVVGVGGVTAVVSTDCGGLVVLPGIHRAAAA